MGSSSLEAKATHTQGGLIVALKGSIDEHVQADDLLPEKDSLIVFNLDGVKRITSYGVLNWLSAMKQLDGGEYAFMRCRPSIVRQFNMVAGFGRHGQLLSIYLPYFCSQCDKEYEQLLDLAAYYEAALARDVPVSYCPICGGKGEFDDAPETYFGFTNEYSQPKVSSALRKLMIAAGPQTRPAPSSEPEESERLQQLRQGLTAASARLAKLRGNEQGD